MWGTVAELEEGLYGDAKEDWIKVLASWDLSDEASRSQLERLMQEALALAERDVRDRFASKVDGGVLGSMFAAFRGFATSQIAEVTS